MNSLILKSNKQKTKQKKRKRKKENWFIKVK